MDLESDETQAYTELPEGIKEPEIFDLRHGLNDPNRENPRSIEEITVDNGTTDGTDRGSEASEA